MKLRRWGLVLGVCGGALLLWSLDQYHRLDRPWGAEHVVAPGPGSPGAARSAVPAPVALAGALAAKNRELEAVVASLGAEVATLKAALRRSGEAAAGALTTMPGPAPVTVVAAAVPRRPAPTTIIPVIPPRRPAPAASVAEHAVPDMATFPNAGKGAAAEAQADSAEQGRRVAAIKAAVKHSFDGYKRHAWGMDDVKPVSGRGLDGKFRHAVTLLDSLDTLWLLGLRNEFDESVAWCKTNLPGRIRALASGTSAFETIIRSLGGLEGAHALSQDAGLLELATQMGDRLIQIVRPDGSTPYTIGGSNGGMGCASLAESGTYVHLHCDCTMTVLWRTYNCTVTVL